MLFCSYGNWTLVQFVVLNSTLAAYIFKSGVRANDVTAVNEGRLKFMHSIILFTEKLSITIYVIVFSILQRRQYVIYIISDSNEK